MLSAFELFGTPGASPVVLSVPHAGRAYPRDIAAQIAVPLAAVLPLEDRYADRLVTAAVASGHVAIVAHVPRLMIDLNRAETDVDPASVTGMRRSGPMSMKARGGLGLVPTRLHGVGELWRAPIAAADFADRVADWHRPYHAALAAALAAAHRRFGRAVLIDLHSMPPLGGAGAAQVVIGSRHGSSAQPEVRAAALRWWQSVPLPTAADAPYAGGHVIDRHGAPAAGIDAIQIEFDRRLYLDDALEQPGAGLAATAARVAAFADSLRSMVLAPAFETESVLAAE